jgi:hypothetical protein
MWCQFYAAPWCRFASVAWPTALHLSAPVRRGWSVAERTAELAALAARLADPLEQTRLRREAQAALVGDAVRSSARRLALLQACASKGDGASDGLLAPGVRIGFEAGGGGVPLLVSGYSLPERWGVWSDGNEARLLLAFAESAPRTLRLVWRLHPFLHGEAQPRVRGTLRIGERRPVALDLADEYVEIVTRVDRGERRLMTAVFTIEDPVSPESLGVSRDPRRLGIGLVEIRAEA